MLTRRVRISVPVLLMLALMVNCTTDPQSQKQYYMQSGRQYLEKGKYEEATIQFRNALQIDPGLTEGYRLLGRSFSALQRWSEAASALTMANELDSKDLQTHLLLAEAYIHTHDYAGALKESGLVLVSDKANAAAYQIQGAAYVGSGQKELAWKSFQEVVHLRPDDPSAWINLSVVEIGLQHSDEAEKDLQKAQAIAPDSGAAYLNLARLYRQQHRSQAAETVLWEGRKNSPQSLDLDIELADALYADGNDQLADSVIKQLREKQPNSANSELLIGDMYSSRQRYDLAEVAYKRAASTSPNDINSRQRIVEAELNQGNLNDASVLNDQILKRDPTNIIAHIARGRILLAKGDVEQSLAELRQQLAVAPGSPQAHYFLGRAYHSDGQASQAELEYRRAIDFDPSLLPALHSLAELLLSRGEAGAIEPANRCVALRPLDASEHLLLGTAYLHQNDVLKAREQFVAAEQLAPRNATAHFDLGLCSVRAHQMEDAEREFEIALDNDPQFAPALNQLTDLYMQLRETAKAIDLLKKHLAAYPNDAQAHLIFGSVYSRVEDYSNAKLEFEQAIRLDGNLLPAYLNLGRTYQAAGQTAAAIQQYESALALQPRFVPLITFLGNLYMDNGDFGTAKKYFERALEIKPDFPIAAGNLAWIYAQQGANLDVALELARRAKQQLPSTNSITDTLGWVEYKRGQYTAAVPLLQECVAKDPVSSIYRYHLGMALLADGKTEKGRQQLQAALRLELKGKDGEEARATLASLN
ncbi:MAG TPA: tetratricopeptide repeat protein [Dongiaceae bacterium]|nr:tetratricopeptide repeat protein [Dongiaceae bacterium]